MALRLARRPKNYADVRRPPVRARAWRPQKNIELATTGPKGGKPSPLRIHIPHRRGIDVAVKIHSTAIADRIAGEPAAKDWGAAMVAGYRCSVFGIAVVDATVRTNVVIATALFTGAFGQQNFIYRDHATAPGISTTKS